MHDFQEAGVLPGLNDLRLRRHRHARPEHLVRARCSPACSTSPPRPPCWRRSPGSRYVVPVLLLFLRRPAQAGRRDRPPSPSRRTAGRAPTCVVHARNAPDPHATARLRTTRLVALAAAGCCDRARVWPRCWRRLDGRRRRGRRSRRTRSRSRPPTTACEVGDHRAAPPAPSPVHGDQHAAARSPSSTSTPTATGSSARSRTSPPASAASCCVELPAGTYQTACKPGMSRRRHPGRRSRSPGGRRRSPQDAALAAGRRRLPALRAEPDRRAARRRPRSSSPRSRPATSPRPRRSTRSPAPTGSGSSRSPRASATSTRKIDGREDDHRAGAWTSPASTASRRTCGSTGDISDMGPIADQLLADVQEIVDHGRRP